MLKLENVVKHYTKKDKNVTAVNDISCVFDEGNFVSVVGRSGSGKSTLLNLIGGLDTASSGHIYFQNKSLSEMKRKELELYRRYSIGMIFQSFNLISYYSAIENVILPMNFADVPRKESRKRAEMLLEQVGLADRMNHIPAELSGGEAQRVAIARSLANNPSLILADEPTGNLDSVTSDEIISLLIDLNKNKGISIIMITHESDIAHKVSDKIITLLDGKILNTQIRTVSGDFQ
jgi:putative ABC transport system ATP-binding protein